MLVHEPGHPLAKIPAFPSFSPDPSADAWAFMLKPGKFQSPGIGNSCVPWSVCPRAFWVHLVVFHPEHRQSALIFPIHEWLVFLCERFRGKVFPSLERARIIINRMPVVYLKRKAHDADKVPQWCSDIMNIEQAQFFTGPLDAQALACQRCAELSAHELNYIREMHCCQNCGGIWHRVCAQRLNLKTARAARDVIVKCQSAIFVCPVCQMEKPRK